MDKIFQVTLIHCLIPGFFINNSYSFFSPLPLSNRVWILKLVTVLHQIQDMICEVEVLRVGRPFTWNEISFTKLLHLSDYRVGRSFILQTTKSGLIETIPWITGIVFLLHRLAVIDFHPFSQNNQEPLSLPEKDPQSIYAVQFQIFPRIHIMSYTSSNSIAFLDQEFQLEEKLNAGLTFIVNQHRLFYFHHSIVLSSSLFSSSENKF